MSWPRVPGGGSSRERHDLLRRHGPHMRVLLKNPFDAAKAIEADALIDTGASCICINRRIAKELGLVRTGETRMIAVGADHPAIEFAGLLCVPELEFEKFLPVYAPDGVYTAPSVLLGRSFLEHFVFTYHGLDGTFQFHNEARDSAPGHDFEE